MSLTTKFSLLLFLTVFSLTACTSSNTDEETEIGMPGVQTDSLKTDYQAWWAYHYDSINLSSEFLPIDAQSKTITKAAFLEQLTTGKYIPLRLHHSGTTEQYQLHPLDSTWNEYVSSTISAVSQVNFDTFKKEGEPFPEFDFRDLEGNSINASTVKDKYLLIKCWFIACKPCIAEMPELNEFKKKYEQRGDVEFVSLAIDDAEPLRKFLTKREFNYSVIPQQGDFMADEVGVNTYPTHIIVGKDGLIKKWVNRFSHLETAMEEVLKSET